MTMRGEMSGRIDRADLASAYDRNWIPVCIGCGLFGGALMAEDPRTRQALALSGLVVSGLALYRTKAIQAEHRNRDFIDFAFYGPEEVR